MISTALWTFSDVGTANLPSYTRLIHLVNTFYAGLAVISPTSIKNGRRSTAETHQSHIRISLDIQR